MSQKQRLLGYLQTHESINPLTAWQVLGIYRLAPRIADLKRDGFRIGNRGKNVTNQFGEKCNVADYYLIKEK